MEKGVGCNSSLVRARRCQVDVVVAENNGPKETPKALGARQDEQIPQVTHGCELTAADHWVSLLLLVLLLRCLDFWLLAASALDCSAASASR